MSMRRPSRPLLALAVATALTGLAACQPSSDTGEGLSAASPPAADAGVANDAAMADVAGEDAATAATDPNAPMASQGMPDALDGSDGNPTGEAAGTMADAGAMAADADMPKGPVDDHTFHMRALEGNVAEIAASQAALQKSKHDGVRQYAQKLQADHTAANQKIATASGMQPPAQPSAKHQAMLAQVAAMDGEAFDRAWLRMMEQDHVKTIALFENAAKSERTSAASKQLAQAMLPSLRDHLQTARRLMKETAGGA